MTVLSALFQNIDIVRRKHLSISQSLLASFPYSHKSRNYYPWGANSSKTNVLQSMFLKLDPNYIEDTYLSLQNPKVLDRLPYKSPKCCLGGYTHDNMVDHQMPDYLPFLLCIEFHEGKSHPALISVFSFKTVT